MRLQAIFQCYRSIRKLPVWKDDGGPLVYLVRLVQVNKRRLVKAWWSVWASCVSRRECLISDAGLLHNLQHVRNLYRENELPGPVSFGLRLACEDEFSDNVNSEGLVPWNVQDGAS